MTAPLLDRLRAAPRWIAVLLAALTVFGPLSMDLYLPVLPNLADDLGTTTSAAQLTMTACLVGLALGQLVAGPLSDRFGRRMPLLTGLAVYSAASIMCALSPDIQALVICRLVQGMAGGVGLVIAQAAGRDIYEGPRLTRYYGRIVVLSGLAAIVAPVIGGGLAVVMTWHGFFVLLASIGAVITVVVAAGFGETLPRAARTGARSGEARRSLALLLTDRIFVGATVSSALTSAAYFAYLAAAPFVLQEIYGLSPAQFALVFGLNAAGFAVFGFTAGRLSERWGERRVFEAGLVLMAVAAGILATATLTTLPLPVAIAAFFLIAAGAAAVSPPSTTLALMDYPQLAGTASSVLGVARFGAGAAAAPLVGLDGAHAVGPLAAVVVISVLAASIVYITTVRPVR